MDLFVWPAPGGAILLCIQWSFTADRWRLSFILTCVSTRRWLPKPSQVFGIYFRKNNTTITILAREGQHNWLSGCVFENKCKENLHLKKDTLARCSTKKAHLHKPWKTNLFLLFHTSMRFLSHVPLSNRLCNSSCLERWGPSLLGRKGPWCH